MTNPYTAPQASMHEPIAGVETYQPSMFAWRGRIGRLRYLAYALGWGLLTTVPLLVLQTLVATAGTTAFWLLQGLIMIVGIVVSAVLGRRRLNDMGYKGWQVIGVFIPFVNIIVALWLIFAAGDAQPNQYGPVPAPNTTGIKIAALALPVLAIVGIIAAVSLGAYSGLQQQRGGASSQSF